MVLFLIITRLYYCGPISAKIRSGPESPKANTWTLKSFLLKSYWIAQLMLI